MSKTVNLKNLSRHMFGKSVLTNGTTYEIDAKGVAKNVKPEDAKKMLAGADWRLVKPSDSQKMASIPDGASEKMRGMLEDAEAEIERLEEQLAGAMKEIERLQGEMEKRFVKEGQGSPLLSDDGQPITDVTDGDPEPDESMNIDELKAMADKLGVSYGPNIGNALMVERIKEATAAAA